MAALGIRIDSKSTDVHADSMKEQDAGCPSGLAPPAVHGPTGQPEAAAENTPSETAANGDSVEAQPEGDSFDFARNMENASVGADAVTGWSPPAASEPLKSKPEARAEDLVSAFKAGEKNLGTYHGHIIKGDVDISGLTYEPRLTLRDITFEGHVSFYEAEFGRSVDLAGCEFRRGLDLRMAEIDGQLVLTDAIIHPEDPSAEDEKARGS